MQTDDEREEEREVVEKSDKSRTDRADEFYCQACEESGVRVSSWDDFTAWNKFVDGSISEIELAEEARKDIAEFEKTFGKYLILKSDGDGKEHSREEEEKKERAKRANKIYKQACHDAGLTVCFFHNFSAWSDYVNKKLSESELYQKALAEIKEMAANASSN